MIVYEDNNPKFGKAFKRISDAFRSNSPKSLSWSTSLTNSDIFFVHTVGGDEYVKLESVYDLSKTVIIQHCVHTTEITPSMWSPLWEKALMVVSFNDIESIMPAGAKFLRLPWGADENLFKVVPNFNKNIKVFSTGHVAKTECLDDVFYACKSTGNVMHHTGENFKWDTGFYKFHPYLPDSSYASLLGSAQYVTGLRLVEGFELSCIEGAMMGTVPIVPDLPSYSFYKDFGIYIDVNEPIAKQLEDIFRAEFCGLTKDQIEYVRNEFSWRTICNRLYSELLNGNKSKII